MRVAVIGSRKFPDLDLVSAFVKDLPPGTMVVSGGAPGVDAAAEFAARLAHLPTLTFRADWDRFGKSAGMRRNADIIANADKVAAFWDGESKGTLNAINLAKSNRKPLVIVYPGLQVEEVTYADKGRQLSFFS